MFSHVTVGVRDLARATSFYDGWLKICGWQRMPGLEEPNATLWTPVGHTGPLFVACLPFDGEAATSGNGQMVAFEVSARSKVDDAYQYALANGATDEGGPGLRPHYHPDYYGAYVRDADGNKICVCCHEPAA
ncbi:MAG: VOC family protein [Pseudomonadota bacterium]